MVVTFGSISIFSAMQTIPMVAGKIYEIRVDVIAFVNSNRTLTINTSSAAANTGIVAITAQGVQIRTEIFYYRAEATQDYYLHIRGGNLGLDSITVDNVSVRELLAGSGGLPVGRLLSGGV
jgi:hypothetical protein